VQICVIITIYVETVKLLLLNVLILIVLPGTLDLMSMMPFGVSHGKTSAVVQRKMGFVMKFTVFLDIVPSKGGTVDFQRLACVAALLWLMTDQGKNVASWHSLLVQVLPRTL
jgi:hypothetical protein